MLYYRRKILLSLLETFGGELTAISLQKLLFLFVKEQEVKAFDFVPHQYGCFSFQANQDVATLKTYGYLNVADKKIQLVKKDNFTSTLNLFDRQNIAKIKNSYGNFSENDLIKYTYINFPYHATKSKIAKNYLNKEELAKVEQEKQKYIFSDFVLFTIGYEGISLETYINKLIVNDIKTLCDVRKNAYSQKYGFSKSQLKMACEGVGIEYVHIPDLGIVSEKRQELNSQNDYNILFAEYENTVLKEQTNALNNIYNLLRIKKRIALTCFEKEPCQCHRTRVAKKMMSAKNCFYTLKEL